MSTTGLRLLAVLGCLMAVYVVATSLHCVATRNQKLPYLDSWASVAEAIEVDAGRFSLHGLWMQHNEHRILVPRLFFLADHFAFSARGILPLCLSWSLQLAQALLLLRLCQRSASLSRAIVVTAGAMFTLYMFSGLQMQNLIDPFQVQFPMVFTAATTAFWALARAARPPRAGIWLVAAIAAGLVCNYSMANGMLVWPLLLTMGWRLGLGRRALLLLSVVGALSIGSYVWGYVTPDNTSNPWDSLLRPHLVFRYLACYLGGPFRLADSEPQCLAAGCAFTLGFLAFAVATRGVMRRTTAPTNHAAIALVHVGLFVLGAASVTALGRIMFPLEQAICPRYTTPALVFWATILALGPAITARWARILVACLTATLAVALVAQQSSGIRFDGALRALQARISLGLLVGIRDLEKHRIYDAACDADQYDSWVAFLQQQRASIFSEDRDAPLGQPLAKAFGPESTAACDGSIDSFEPVPDSGWGFRVAGWAYDRAARQTPRAVCFVDDSGVVIGLADMDTDRPDVRQLLPDIGDSRIGFFGYCSAGARHPPITAYARMPDGRMCRIAAQLRFDGTEPGALAPGRPIAQLEELRHGDWLPLQPTGWPLLPASYDGAACSTEPGIAKRLFSPITAATGVLGVPVAVGPRALGLSVQILDLDTFKVLRKLLAPPTYDQWSVWRLEWTPELAGKRLGVLAVDDGSGSGQRLAIAPPFWIQ